MPKDAQKFNLSTEQFPHYHKILAFFGLLEVHVHVFLLFTLSNSLIDHYVRNYINIKWPMCYDSVYILKLLSSETTKVIKSTVKQQRQFLKITKKNYNDTKKIH